MFDYIMDDLAAGRQPDEMAVRFAFWGDLREELRNERPLPPVCVAYHTLFPQWEGAFEADYLIELLSGFQSDEEIEEEIAQSDREEAERRDRLSQTSDGRRLLEREDREFARMVQCARLRYEEEEARARRPIQVQRHVEETVLAA